MRNEEDLVGYGVENGDVLYMFSCKQEPKAVRQEDGSWGRDYKNKEWWLYEYEVKSEN